MEQPPFWGIAPSRAQARRERRRDRPAWPATTAVLGVLALLLSAAALAVMVGELLAPPDEVVSAQDPAAGPGVATVAATAPPPAPGRTVRRAVPARGSARDGSFAFAVRGVHCGPTRIGDSSFEDSSRGVFCLVKLRITNIGTEARTFDSSSQLAFDSGGRRHEPSQATTVVRGASSLLDDIGPGASVDGTVVFDVPAGTHLRELELHDSPYSGGVRLGLSATTGRPVRQACRRSC